MQTNPNKEDKNIVEIWEWKDTPWQYSPGIKKYCRKLRRRRQKRLSDKLIEQAKDTGKLNIEICEDFKYTFY